MCALIHVSVSILISIYIYIYIYDTEGCLPDLESLRLGATLLIRGRGALEVTAATYTVPRPLGMPFRDVVRCPPNVGRHRSAPAQTLRRLCLALPGAALPCPAPAAGPGNVMSRGNVALCCNVEEKVVPLYL